MNNIKIVQTNESAESNLNNIPILIKIDGWVSPIKEYRGKYRDEHEFGYCGFYRRDFKNHSRMYVFNRGNILNYYNYPKVNMPFSSEMVRWENLYYCGGYGIEKEDGTQVYTEDSLFQTVIDGLKPMAFVIVREDDRDRFIYRAEENGLMYTINPHFYKDHCEVAVTHKGRIKDYFDLTDFIESYRIMSRSIGYEILSYEEEKFLLEKSDLNLSDFLSGFDYVNPITNADFALTGLLLGYPIESTVAILTK
jgi:hypothetical protein